MNSYLINYLRFLRVERREALREPLRVERRVVERQDDLRGILLEPLFFNAAATDRDLLLRELPCCVYAPGFLVLYKSRSLLTGAPG